MGVYELYCNHPAIEDMLFRFFSEAKVRIRLQVHHIVTLTKLSLSLSLVVSTRQGISLFVLQAINKKVSMPNRSFFVCLLAPFQVALNYIPIIKMFIDNIAKLDPPHPDITKRRDALSKFETIQRSIVSSQVRNDSHTSWSVNTRLSYAEMAFLSFE